MTDIQLVNENGVIVGRDPDTGEKVPISFETIQTATLNNIKDASQFPGADGGTQIQNAIDEANNEAGPNIVVVDGAGPDDVSGSTGSVSDSTRAQNAWKLSAHLSVPSFTTLIVRNAYIFLADSADDNLVRNDDFTNGNEHIAIVGDGNAVFDGNFANQTNFDKSTADARKGIGLRFFIVDNLTLRGFKVRRTEAWGIKAEDVTDFDAENLRFQQGTDTNYTNRDGVHVVGPADSVTIDDIQGQTFDDSVTVGANEPSGFAYNDGSGGDVTNVSVSNVNTEVEKAQCVRIFEGDDKSGTLHSIRNVTVENITYRGNGGGAVVLGDGNDVDDTTKFTDITVNNITAQDGFAVEVASAIRDFDFSGLTARNATRVLWFTHGKDTSLASFKSKCNGGSVRGIHGTEVSYLLQLIGDGGIEDSTFEDFTLKSEGDTSLSAFVSHNGTNEEINGCVFAGFAGFANGGSGSNTGTLVEDTSSAGDFQDNRVTDVRVRQVETIFDLDSGSANIEVSDINVGTFSTAYTTTDPIIFGDNVELDSSTTANKPVGAHATMSSNQTVPGDDTETVVAFDSTQYEHTEVATLDETNNEINIQKGGVWHIEYQLTMGTDINDGEIYEPNINLNGSTITEFFVEAGSAFTNGRVFTITRELSAGDTITGTIEQNTGNDRTVSSPDRRTFLIVSKRD